MQLWVDCSQSVRQLFVQLCNNIVRNYHITPIEGLDSDHLIYYVYNQSVLIYSCNLFMFAMALLLGTVWELFGNHCSATPSTQWIIAQHLWVGAIEGIRSENRLWIWFIPSARNIWKIFAHFFSSVWVIVYRVLTDNKLLKNIHIQTPNTLASDSLLVYIRMNEWMNAFDNYCETHSKRSLHSNRLIHWQSISGSAIDFTLIATPFGCGRTRVNQYCATTVNRQQRASIGFTVCTVIAGKNISNGM